MATQQFGKILCSGQGRVQGPFTLGPDFIAWMNPVASKKTTISKSDMESASWISVRTGCQLKLNVKGGTTLRYTGFKQSDFTRFKEYAKTNWDMNIETVELNSRGGNWGDFDFDGNSMRLVSDNKMIMELPLSEVTQCVNPPNKNNEVEIQFTEATTSKNRERVLNMVLFVPHDKEKAAEQEDGEETLTGGQELQREIVERAGIRSGNTAGSAILVFDEKVGTFLTPRGRYSIKMFDNMLFMSGKTYDYQIMYSHIARLFLLPLPENRGNNVVFVVSLSVPIRQGQQRYAHLVMQVQIKEHTLAVNLDEEEIETRFGPNSLAPEMEGDLHKLLAKAFKVLTKRKIYTVGRFISDGGDKSVRCALQSNDGMLFPLQKSFFFIHKPPTFIPFDSIQSVEFQRYSGTHASAARSFDLCVTNNSVLTFTSIDRKEYSNLMAFLQTKNIRIKNKGGGNRGQKIDIGPDDDEDDSESDDSDWDGGDVSEGSSEDDSDFSDSGGSDSEAENAHKKRKENKKDNRSSKESKKKSKSKRKGNSDEGSGKKKRKKE